MRPVGDNPAAIRVSLPAGRTYRDTAVARRGPNAWFAVVTPAPHEESRDVAIYRLSQGRWRLADTVEIRAFPPIESVAVASLTNSGAPDFTVHDSGADTAWLAVISRAGGRWHQVPFNRPPDARRSVSGVVEGHLIEASVDGYGGAGGPTTMLWYRYVDGAFIPTRSPNESESCSKAALEGSRRLPGGEVKGEGPDGIGFSPWTAADLTRHLDVERFACIDGWAATTSAGRAGGTVLALYGHRRGQWLRVAAGTPKLVADHGGIFAAPASLLAQITSEIGVRIAVASKPFGHSYEPADDREYTPPAPERATLSFPVSPGSNMSATIGRENDNGALWLASAIEEPPSTASSHAIITAAVYRWDGHAWKRQTETAFAADKISRASAIEVKDAYLTGSSTPDFAIKRSYRIASGRDDRIENAWSFWTSVISDLHHRWEVVPFVQRHRATAEVRGMAQPVHPVDAENRESSATIFEERIEPERFSGRYDYHAGAFELKPYHPTPTG